MDVVITLVKSDEDIIVLQDGKVIDHWYVNRYDYELPYSKVDILNEYLFGTGDKIK